MVTKTTEKKSRQTTLGFSKKGLGAVDIPPTEDGSVDAKTVKKKITNNENDSRAAGVEINVCDDDFENPVGGEKDTDKEAKGKKKKKTKRAAKPEAADSENDIDVTSLDPVKDTKKASGSKEPAKKRKAAGKGKAKASPMVEFDLKYVQELAVQYPTNVFEEHTGEYIEFINEQNPLVHRDQALLHAGSIYSMALSDDGHMLATFSIYGSIRVWDCEEWTLLTELFCKNDDTVNDFYCGLFLPDNEHVVVGGKCKDRNRWSEEDDDNYILPCPLLIINLLTGEVVNKLEGHKEEILFVERVQFKGENHFLSCSQDGTIIKWHMDSSWLKCLGSSKMEDESTCMAFAVSVIPNCGGKYFVAACDEHLRLYDFEQGKLVQTFGDLYTSYCDFVKIVHCYDKEDLSDDECYLLTRGVELLEEGDDFIPKKPNSCMLHKLTMPSATCKTWKLVPVKKYEDEEYHANSWLQKISTNGRYLAAPTVQGEVFVWNIESGEKVAVLKYHEEREVRDILFHPLKKTLLTCADDGTIQVYNQ
eukprot:Nk52_evm22s96 gene=Nk52_evmTU22s96